MNETKNNLNKPPFPPNRIFVAHWPSGEKETTESIERTDRWYKDLADWKKDNSLKEIKLRMGFDKK